MAQQPASTLGFVREGLTEQSGQPKRGFLKWMQKIEVKTNAALSTLGINPNATIVGTNKTVGGVTQNLSNNGVLPTSALSGTVTPDQVGFTLDEVPNGTKRFAVSQIDSASLAIINFADTQHENKTLDNINNGTTYQRFTRVASGSTTLGSGSIGSGVGSVSTASAAGVLATDTILWSLNGGPVAGYSASASGSLYILAYALSGSVNFYVGNPTIAPIIAGAQVVNWQVIR